MMSLRSVATVFGFAAMTTAAVVTVFWPKATLADGDAANAELTLDGTKVNHVVVTADLVQDTKSKTGWVIEVNAENRGAEAETAELETDLTRQLTSPMLRAQPTPTAVFKKKETVTVAAGEKIKRSYDVPANLAAQITAAKKAADALEKAMNAGKILPIGTTVPYFSVALKGPWTDEQIAPPANRKMAAAPRANRVVRF